VRKEPWGSLDAKCQMANTDEADNYTALNMGKMAGTDMAPRFE